MISQVLKYCLDMGETSLAAFSSDDPASTDPLDDRLASKFRLSDNSILGALGSFIRHPTYPLQAHLLSSGSAAAKLETTILEFKPDIVIFDMLRTMASAVHIRQRFPNLPMLIDLDDMLSLRYDRMLKASNHRIDSTFADRIPKSLRGITSLAPAAALAAERLLMRRAERRISTIFDGALMVSSREATNLQTYMPPDFKITPMPPAADRTPTVSVFERKIPTRAIFMGNAKQYANADTLLRLDKIADDFKFRSPNSTLRFESAGVKNDNLHLKHVKQIGFIDNIETFLHDGAIFVAPITTGTGIKLKIIDAMLNGVPVMTTDIGAEAIEVFPRDHYLHCETNAEFVDSLLRIESGEISIDQLQGMATTARQTISVKHDNAMLQKSFQAAVDAAISRRALLAQ